MLKRVEWRLRGSPCPHRLSLDSAANLHLVSFQVFLLRVEGSRVKGQRESNGSCGAYPAPVDSLRTRLLTGFLFSFRYPCLQLRAQGLKAKESRVVVARFTSPLSTLYGLGY
jgi:hypothetical protein